MVWNIIKSHLFPRSKFLSNQDLNKLARTDPRFKVKIGDSARLCPYCLRAVPKQRLLRHIKQSCSKYDPKYAEPHSMHKLKQRKKEIKGRQVEKKIQSKIKNTSLWRMVDQGKNWYCPFCAQKTEIKMDWDQTSQKKIIKQIKKHVMRCTKFEGNLDRTVSKKTLKKRITRYNRRHNMKEKIKRKIQLGDQRYLQTNEEGHWICPYCLSAKKSIPMDTEFLMKNNAPPKIAKHLLTNCPPSLEGEKICSLEEIKSAAGERPSESEESGDALPSSNTQFIDDMREEIEELRSEMETESSSSSSSSESLEKATRIHKQMLPKQLPNIPSYDLGFVHRKDSPSVGEFYDVIDIDRNRFGFLFARLQGGGDLDLALLLSLVKKAFRIRTKEKQDPETILQKVNSDILPEMPDEYHVECVYWILNTQNNRIQHLNAGYEKGFVYDSEKKKMNSIESRGIPLGVKETSSSDLNLNSVSFRLSAGDLICQITPGYSSTEESSATPGKKHLWIQKYIQSNASQSADSIATGLDRKYRERTDQNRIVGYRSLLILRKQQQ